ncbi:MAG: addiction module protein [Micrococcales bacterium]|nr:addiction module protein [Micrococcales bacterium]
MVTPALQETLGSLSPAERLDVIDFLQRTLVPASDGLSEPQKETIRQRDAQMEVDPSIGLTWDELDSRMQHKWG